MSLSPRSETGASDLAGYLGIVAVGMLLGLPALIFGAPARGHDAVPNALLYLHFAEQLWQGEVYPRWLLGHNQGLGAPAMFLIPPLEYYLMSPLYPLMPADAHGWQQFALSLTAATMASGAAFHLWIRPNAGRVGAIIGAVTYMILPYHVAFDGYIRAAYGETWAFVWMPLVLWGIEGVARGQRYAVVLLALSYSCLILTHAPLTLIFSVFAVFYPFAVAERGTRVRVAALVAISFSLGIGLAAIFLVPALGSLDAIEMSRTGWTGHNNFENRFLFSAKQLDFEPFWNTVLSVFIVATAIIAALVAASQGTASLKRPRMLFWLAVAAVSIFMMLPVSALVWHTVSIFQRAQLPERYNVTLVLATAAIVALTVAAPKRQPRMLSRAMMVLAGCIGLAIVPVSAIFAIDGVTQPREESNRRIDATLISSVYWPIWAYAKRPELRARLLRENIRYSYLEPYIEKFGVPLSRRLIGVPSKATEILRWRPRDIAFRLDLNMPAKLLVGQLYYPGWTAWIKGQKCCLPLRPSNPDGLVEIDVPAGKHVIELRLRAGLAERAGQAISAVSLVLVLLLAAMICVRRYREAAAVT